MNKEKYKLLILSYYSYVYMSRFPYKINIYNSHFLTPYVSHEILHVPVVCKQYSI